MKYFLFFIILVGFSIYGSSQNIIFSDIDFKNFLLQSSTSNIIARDLGNNNIKIDSNNDGEIQINETLNVYKIFNNVHLPDITDLTGIEKFSNLTELVISTDINTIDLSGNPNLTYLDLSRYSNTPGLTSINLSPVPNLLYFGCNYNSFNSLDLSGVPNLTDLSIVGNNFISLDLSNVPNLSSLNCCNNSFLNSINLSNVPNLKKLYFDGTLINSIDLSSVLQLRELLCNTKLSSLDVTGLTLLESLTCNDLYLHSLDLSHNTNLKILVCVRDSLNSLNLSMLTKLSYLDCSINNLEFLDLSNNPLLKTLHCNDNNLKTILMKNGSKEIVFLNNNPNLQYICCDENQIDTVNTILNNNLFSNISVNTYCSFVPGGKHNTVSGNLIFDTNNNGCDSSDSMNVNNVKIEMTDSSKLKSSTFTEGVNHYQFYPLVGAYIFTPKVENGTLFTINPINYPVNFIDSNFNVINRDFCITANTPKPDLEIVFAPILEAQSGVDAKYEIIYKNKGNQALSGQIQLLYPNTFTKYISSSVNPSSTNTGIINWNFTTLQPFEYRRIQLLFHTNNTSQSPAVNIGDTLPFEVSISPTSGDFSNNDNHFKFKQIVVDTLSPNLITCLEGRVVPAMNASDNLHYNIEFENLSSDTISNVVVKQIVDTIKFNINSLQLLNSSHPVYTRIEGNKVEFICEDMALGDHNHGNILFKMEIRIPLNEGDTIDHKGEIYFDYNKPLKTNDAKTTFKKLMDVISDSTDGLSTNKINYSITLFPNPSRGIFNIQTKNTIQLIELYDISGRLLITKIGNDKTGKLDITDKINGIYFVKITTDKGVNIFELHKD